MEKIECELVQDLLPLYVEGIVSDKTHSAVMEHLDGCKECRDILDRMRVDLKIIQTEEKPGKKVLRYINFVKIWYMFCPLSAVLLLTMDSSYLLYLYEGLLLLICIICAASQLYYKSAWWEPENMEIQEEVRRKTKKKYGKFYISPVWIGMPAFLVYLSLKLPYILNFFKNYIFK